MDLRLDVFESSNPEELRNGLFKSLAGYSEVFPGSPDARILLKPNLNSNMNALTGNTTDLRLLAAIMEFLKEHSYSNIVIGDGTNSGYYRHNIGVIGRLRVHELARYFGAKVKDLNHSGGRLVALDNGVKAQVAIECLESDLFINVPKLKTHFETGMSVCLKSLIGCLVGQENKKKVHQDLASNILALNRQVKPQLHIVDGLIAMEGLGPTRGTPIRLDTIIVGTDPYLIDLYCARLAGIDYRSVTTLQLAEWRGTLTAAHHDFLASGSIGLKSAKFKPARANRFAGFIHHPRRQKHFLKIRNTSLFSYLASTHWFGRLLFQTGLRQDIFCLEEMELESLTLRTERCSDCGLCRRYCPIQRQLPAALGAPDQFCLQCLYCFMICPHEAIMFNGKPGFLLEQIRQYDERIRSLHSGEQ